MKTLNMIRPFSISSGNIHDRARLDLGIPDKFDVMAMIDIGKRGPKENLPPKLQEREFPNDRKPLNEIVMDGKFRS
jgi:hypothetical protein